MSETNKRKSRSLWPFGRKPSELERLAVRMMGESGDPTAYKYGRKVQALPDIHIFSRLSEMDDTLAGKRADLMVHRGTLHQQVQSLAEQLGAPSENSPKRRGRRERREA